MIEVGSPIGFHLRKYVPLKKYLKRLSGLKNRCRFFFVNLGVLLLIEGRQIGGDRLQSPLFIGIGPGQESNRFAFNIRKASVHQAGGDGAIDSPVRGVKNMRWSVM